MKTVQMTLDEDLLYEVDRIAKELQINRSAFTREALKAALNNYKIRELESKHRQGYKKHPVTEDEFSVWESEQVWDG